MRAFLVAVVLSLALIAGRVQAGPVEPAAPVAVIDETDFRVQLADFLGMSDRQVFNTAVGAVAGFVVGMALGSGTVPILAGIAGGALGYLWTTHGQSAMPQRIRSIDIACVAPECAAPH